MKTAFQKAFILALIFILYPAISAQAAETDPRFTMRQTEDGFLRLDSQTGAVALCARAENGWSCKPVDDNQLAHSNEFAAVKKENGELKHEIEELKRALDSQFAARKPSGGSKPIFKIPSDEDVDKFMSFLERMAKKFKGMVKELKENKEQGTPL